MNFEEFMKKEGPKALSQLKEQQSMDALKEFLQQKGVTITDEEEERLNQLLSKNKKGRILSDEQLDSINGGGYYSPIHDCPNGHTKYVHWFGRGRGKMDDNCNTCEFVRESTGKVGKILYCSNVSSERIWEW